jgi:hypothetical protein
MADLADTVREAFERVRKEATEEGHLVSPFITTALPQPVPVEVCRGEVGVVRCDSTLTGCWLAPSLCRSCFPGCSLLFAELRSPLADLHRVLSFKLQPVNFSLCTLFRDASAGLVLSEHQLAGCIDNRCG